MAFKLVATLTLLIAALFSPFQAVAALYDFTDTTTYLAPAEQMETWHAVLEKHQQQRHDLLACISERGCRGRLKSFNRMLAKGMDLTEDEKIQLVNYYINRNDYDRDFPQRVYDEAGKKIGVQRSHWSTLYDFLTQGGDCEDYATSKYFMLRELGLDADDMRVVVTYTRDLRGYHAVLAVRRNDGSVWLLDSDNRIQKKWHAGHRYIFAVNEHSIWDHRKDYVGASH